MPEFVIDEGRVEKGVLTVVVVVVVVDGVNFVVGVVIVDEDCVEREVLTLVEVGVF